MKSILTSMLIIGMNLLLIGSTIAQRQDEDRRGERRGGERRGGFAGRFNPLGGRMGDPVMGLLQIDEVRKELEVSDEQHAALEKLAERTRQQRAAKERPNFREMSDQERADFIEKMRGEQAEQTAKAKELLEEVLLPGQIERLDEISLQVRGVAALEDEQVRAALKLTEEQVSEFAETRQSIQSTVREKMQAMFRSGDRTAMREAFSQMRRDIETKMLAVLTDEQKSKFEEMKGKPFDMPERGFGRRGRERP